MGDELVVDRVYKASLPELRRALEDLRREFAQLGPRVDWGRVRVRPVLDHAVELERLLRSPKFERQFSRLAQGVDLFHSDLLYLRANVKGLARVLDAEKRSRQRRGPPR